MARILLVEDDASLTKILSYHLERAGHRIREARDGAEALEAVRAALPDLIITDVKMPRMDGMGLLRKLTEGQIQVPVIVLTAFGTINDAVQAMRLGATDYLTKPVDRETLLLAVAKALKVRALEAENRSLRERLEEKSPQDLFLGASPAMARVKEVISQVAGTDATVLITGESGTGKELAARAIHAQSSRGKGPFVALNCAAVPRDLLESELFGHVRGAFTGAVADNPGKFRQADKGTLFLDEIGDMDLELQSKILRSLQERIVDPVGGKRGTPVDVRLVAATHRDLRSLIGEGRFREDLYWRLNVIPLAMPALRERPEDIPLLLRHFYHRFAGRDLRIEARAERLILTYFWPGNVRELLNLCQRLAVLHANDEIAISMLPKEIAAARPREQPAGELEGGLWEIERDAILNALADSRGNKAAAARALKVPRHVLLYRMKKFGI